VSKKAILYVPYPISREKQSALSEILSNFFPQNKIEVEKNFEAVAVDVNLSHVSTREIIAPDDADEPAVNPSLSEIQTETTKDIESVAVVTTFTKLGGEVIGASTQYFIDTPDGVQELAII
jgi:hypothetical protein